MRRVLKGWTSSTSVFLTAMMKRRYSNSLMGNVVLSIFGVIPQSKLGMLSHSWQRSEGKQLSEDSCLCKTR